MSKHPVRRSQMVVPSGVGALTVFPDGVSLMTCGLDHWFSELVATSKIDSKDFVIDEWRLRDALGVDHFRLPPDFRQPWEFQGETMNVGIKIPATRFPLEHSCHRCNRLTSLPPSLRTTPPCEFCKALGRRGRLHQVQFIAMCEAGHLQDFPWREWVHRAVRPACKLPLKLFAAGGASLLGVHVKCECGKQRNLAGVTEGDDEKGTSVLSDQLADGGARYLCAGNRPWLLDREECGRVVRGGLRSASNTYFARTTQAIYIPKLIGDVPAQLIDALQAPPLAQGLLLLRAADERVSQGLAGALKTVFPGHLEAFSEKDIGKAIQLLNAGRVETRPTGTEPTDLKTPEFRELTSERDEGQLKVRVRPVTDYTGLAECFGDVSLVDKLRVTRAFTGFSRIRSAVGGLDFAQLRRRIRSVNDKWLPASLVFGEGVLLRLDEHRLSTWEKKRGVIERVARMQARYDATKRGELQPRVISPRLVLLHTLAHAVIQRLAFESGYSAASIAERIYASHDPAMAGVLLYTAAGDSEGTLGGLVRLGSVGRLEPVLRRALERAGWCSADPICMELGDGGGQGPDSCNGAACHNCALLPETACEEFNAFLDRALLVGSPSDRGLGFFVGSRVIE